MKFIVFWVSSFVGSNPGWSTPKVQARFQEFVDQEKAQKFFEKMAGLARRNETYQSRMPSYVTKTW